MSPETLRSAGVEPKPAPGRLLAWATVEIQRSLGRAFVEVTYLGNGELFSLFRVDLRDPRVDVNGVDPLYEVAYEHACVAAACHGYELDRFTRVYQAPRGPAFAAMAAACGERVVLALQRRPVNGLNVEIGQPLDRCRLRTPPEWGDVDPRGARWIHSGGDPMILGVCGRARCPRLARMGER